MMNFDARTIYERWMDKAYKLERDGSYTMAMGRYEEACKLAKEFEDSAYTDALKAITRCKEKIQAKNRDLLR